MPNELTGTLRLDYRNGLINNPFQPGPFRVDQTIPKYVDDTQDISDAAHEAIDFGDITSRGYFGVTNHSADKYVQLGKDVAGTFDPFARIGPGLSSLIELEPAAAIYAKAEAASGGVTISVWCVSR